MSETLYRIPLTNTPQTFDLELGARLLTITCRWNETSSVWMLDIADASTGEILTQSLPLVAGVDLLEQYAHLDIPGIMGVYTEGDPTAPPTYDNLGSASNLYFLEVTA